MRALTVKISSLFTGIQAYPSVWRFLLWNKKFLYIKFILFYSIVQNLIIVIAKQIWVSVFVVFCILAANVIVTTPHRAKSCRAVSDFLPYFLTEKKTQEGAS